MRGRKPGHLWMQINRSLLTVALCSAIAGTALAQDRLPTMPGYERYSRLLQELRGGGRRSLFADPLGFVGWNEDSSAFAYRKDGKYYRYDMATRTSREVQEPERVPTVQRPQFPAGGFLQRGRQFLSALSPDKQHKAFYKDYNLWLSDADDKNPVALTLDGSQQARLKYGTASWVYGEELGQRTAIWWAPDSKQVAFYRFDESKVPDYYVTLKTLQTQDVLNVEAFPTAGTPNPVVDILIYHLDTKQTTHVDVRDGKPFDDTAVGYYVYNVRWSRDGKELLFNRTNRKQDIMELAACDPASGHCRVVVREEWPASWTDNNPDISFLKDGRRFLLVSQRNGWRNLYLYDLHGGLLAPVTQNTFDFDEIVRVDETAGLVYYMADDGDNPMKAQLHRVGLDGRGDVRLTDPTLNHQVQLAPDGKHFLDHAETHAQPPITRLVDAQGHVLDELARTDTSKATALGLHSGEVFTYKAADGKTDLYGILYKPSNFDPNKKYPLLVSVYAGPDTQAVSEMYTLSDPITELGFLVAAFDSRGGSGRGKRFEDEIYGKLGTVEIDDQAAGVKFLRQRPYVDGTRVGIYGTSYGGYASAMCLLRYPDVFQAACASSSVTDWRNYDTIYTERYMGLPQTNKTGYDAGSAMTYAGNLKGRLMLYYGTADNNVHPANTFQLIAALQRAGKSFDLQVGPDLGHSGLPRARMLEFFIDNLIQHPPATIAQTPGGETHD